MTYVWCVSETVNREKLLYKQSFGTRWEALSFIFQQLDSREGVRSTSVALIGDEVEVRVHDFQNNETRPFKAVKVRLPKEKTEP